MSATSVQGKLGVLGVLLALGLPACVSIGTLDVPAPNLGTSKPLPLSVKVEIQNLALFDKKPLGFGKHRLPWRWEKEHLRQSLVTYLQKRKTFREVVDGPSDLVLRVDAELLRHIASFPHEGYDFSIQGQLILSQPRPATSGIVGSYAEKATRVAPTSEVLFTRGISGPLADLTDQFTK